jgi:hypothetical protein
LFTNNNLPKGRSKRRTNVLLKILKKF